MSRNKHAARRKRRKTDARQKAIWLTFFGVALVVVSVFFILRAQRTAQPLAGAELIARGEHLYAQNCAACHGGNGEGHVIPEAPALNGNEHAWHHADGQLQRTILDGGQIMPPFREKLSRQDAAAIIRFIQAWWQDGQLASQQSVSSGDPLQ